MEAGRSQRVRRLEIHVFRKKPWFPLEMQARKQKLKGFAKETTKGKAQSVPSLKREREKKKKHSFWTRELGVREKF